LTRAVGIDLGVTDSVVAVLEGGEPWAIANAEGSRTTPSVVAFAPNGEVLVGEVARRRAAKDPGRTIHSVRRRMGTDWTVKIDGKKFTAQQISAFILQKLKMDAEAYLGETITEAVITVPAYFNDVQRQATKEAGQLASLNVLRIINEPTSAALAYHLERENEATILVFDLGRQTFNVSLLEVVEGVIEVVASSDDNLLGGDDWDQRIVDWLVQDFKNGYGVDLSQDKMALQRLRESAEKAVVDLSGSAETQINLPYITHSEHGPLHLDARLTRAEFQKMTSDLLGRCKASLEVMLDARRRVGYVDHIDHVVLVGQSTQMPAVADLVRDLSDGKEPHKGIYPGEVVAIGACIQAAVLKDEISDPLLDLFESTATPNARPSGFGNPAGLAARSTSVAAAHLESPSRIFISYRRDDTAYPCGWLFDKLAQHFGRSRIFKDIDSIQLGDDFAEEIRSAVERCDVLLALIGQRWLTITDEGGRRRLDNPSDFVRLEIEAAIARDIRIIPILIEGARIPCADELPTSLAKLARRQALELSSRHFDFDISRLLKVLDRTLGSL
jgi:molecular chaperone DnaK (HSP70)